MADPKNTADLTNADLERRIAELERENRALKRDRDSQPTVPLGDGSLAEPPRSFRDRNWAWTLLAAVLIVVGSLLAPVALVSSWARIALTDTDAFVSQYEGLADDPAIQQYVTDEALIAINDAVDIPQITSDVIDGVTNLGTGPAATDALEMLKGPAASGVQSILTNGVTRFVESAAFADVWESALRVSHTQVTAALANDPNAAITLDAAGGIGIQIGPIIDAVKTALVNQGFELAAKIPSVDRTIVVAQSDAIPIIQLAYGITITVGTWLPWVSLLLLATGVIVARRRVVALIWAAVALALAMVITLSGFAAGSLASITALSPETLPANVVGVLYETIAEDMRATAIAVLVLAIVVIIVAWCAGPFRLPRKMRARAVSAAGAIRAAAQRHGITTGRFGEWMYRQRRLLRAAVAVIASAVIVFVRPITPSLIIWTLVVAVLAIIILELVQRPPETDAPEASSVEGEHSGNRQAHTGAR